jgi:hypothetical protein
VKPTPVTAGILVITFVLLSGLSQPAGALQQAPQPDAGETELAAEASEILQSIDEKVQVLRALKSPLE